MPSSPTSVRIPPETRRKLIAAARRHGKSLGQFMVDAALKEASETNWAGFFAAHPPVKLPKNAPRDLSTREGFGG